MRWVACIARVLFPQRTVCHACNAPLTCTEGLLCTSCEQDLVRCQFQSGRAQTVVNEDIDIAVSAFAYQGAAATLVKALKFGSDQTAALPLAQALAALYATLTPLQTAELCVPVPVHYRRLKQRGYNQSAILGEAFCALTNLPMAADALVRLHHRHSQIGNGRQERLNNIQGAFAVSSQGEYQVAGKHVLLLDDVFTTGATAVVCAQALRAAGARSVLLLTVCRA